MENVPEGHPFRNPGIEAALVRLGMAIFDYAEAAGRPSVPRTDEAAMLAASSHIGCSAISGLPPTVAVALIDQTNDALSPQAAA